MTADCVSTLEFVREKYRSLSTGDYQLCFSSIYARASRLAILLISLLCFDDRTHEDVHAGFKEHRDTRLAETECYMNIEAANRAQALLLVCIRIAAGQVKDRTTLWSTISTLTLCFSPEEASLGRSFLGSWASLSPCCFVCFLFLFLKLVIHEVA